MPYRFAFLLIVLCVSARAVYAQENTGPLPAPQNSPSASVCSHVPDVDTDSDAYNTGFSDGYKAGCKHASSAQPSTSSGIHLDDAVSDTPAPTSSLKEENDNLLKLIGEVCKGADIGARRKGASQNETWNLKYRIAVLTGLIEKPPSDCQ
jgi:hypothetical protein